eukprot:gnl/Trimastix_PCT/815.p1 GENE.gnl/Trimastix_PCT/815~~gnl/Trimastix_PCT/815.p1  ORF type:complete len:558 (-),score=181.56 gnl/Trimastix_PCT/815:115-1734(-)
MAQQQMNKLGFPREIHPLEKRVAMVPTIAQKLIKKGYEIWIEEGAGEKAGFANEQYAQVGCHVVPCREVYANANVVIKINPPDVHPVEQCPEISMLRENTMFIAYLWPHKNPELIEELARRNVVALSMDRLPRTTKAQAMDTLSSQAKVTGKRAVIEAASHFQRFLSGEMTSAGKNPPAKCLVLGAGVAGLEAIGTAKKLGCEVRAFDVRPAVKEEVQSLGGKFLETTYQEDGSGSGGYARESSEAAKAAQRDLFMQQAREIDIIITTANLPGRQSPILVPEEMIRVMKPGSVIVDLAAANGGNTALTRPNEVIVTPNGITICGAVDYESRMATQASIMYANNMANLLEEIGMTELDYVNNEIVQGLLQTINGQKYQAPPKPAQAAVAPQPDPKEAEEERARVKAAEEAKKKKISRVVSTITLILFVAILVILGIFAPGTFLSNLTIFILSIIAGSTIIWNVAAALHTPLMSVTNAISGIVLISTVSLVDHFGKWAFEGKTQYAITPFIAIFGTFVAAINVTGGFLVTQKMLRMFKARK